MTPAQSAYLDVLRGGAAQAVLVGHALLAFSKPGPVARAVPHTIGVLVFFLLSGFLISLTTLRKASRDPQYGIGAYLAERGFRIFTPYVPALFFVAIVDRFSAHSPQYRWSGDFTIATWFANLFMLQDYPLFQVLRRLGVSEQSWFFGPFGSGRPFWTISIEWWIYLLFGAGLFLLVREGRWRSIAVVALAAFLAVEPAYHFVAGFGQCLTMIWVVGMLLAIGDSAIAARIGVLWSEFGGRVLLALATAVLALFAVLRLADNGLRVYELQFGLFAAGFLFLVYHLIGASRAGLPDGLRAVPRFVADFSYSLYLTHFTLLTWLLTLVAEGRLDRSDAFWLCLAGSNLVAIMFWWLFERHHRALARGFVAWMRARVPAGAAASPGSRAE